MRVDERYTVIREDALRYSELAEDIVIDEVGHNQSDCAFYGYSFDPFGIAFCCCEDPDVTSKRGIDEFDEVKSPSVEWPRSL